MHELTAFETDDRTTAARELQASARLTVRTTALADAPPPGTSSALQ